MKLAGYPSTLTTGFLSYNYIFLQVERELGGVACEKIGLAELVIFVDPEDGFYVFELGVINVDCYWFRDSIGTWTFDVTLVPS